MATAIVLIPATYAVKDAFGLSATIVHWVDPTLILTIPIILLARPAFRPISSSLLALYCWVAAIIGAALLAPPDIYTELREPFRLTLCITWFWACCHFCRRREDLVLRWLAVSVAIQLALGALLELVALGWWTRWVPPTLEYYEKLYLYRQSIWAGGHIIPRMGGTFIESPPFGLFMFSALSVFVAARLIRGLRAPSIKLGILASVAGLIASLSDQILVAFVVMVAGALLSSKRLKKSVATAAALALLASALIAPIALRLVAKAKKLSAPSELVLGQSASERVFHAKYSLKILSNQPISILFGVGPGRYGQYAARTGIFPPTVVPQVTPVAWLIGYGLLGTLIFAAFLMSVLRPRLRPGRPLRAWLLLSLLLANGFQANWKWEGWFLALAYLWASTRHPTQDHAEQPQTPNPMTAAGAAAWR